MSAKRLNDDALGVPESPAPACEPASKSVLLLDISRLIWRARRRGPTGIDRVELAYAEHFIAVRRDRAAYAVLHLFGFLFAIDATGGRRFVEELRARWQGSTPARGNLLAVIKIYIGLLISGWHLGPWLRRRLRVYPGSPIFLVVSHHHVARGYTIDRLRCSLGMKTVCFIHDLLPIDYPEYFKRGWEQRYRLLSSNLARYFDAVIANSQSTADTLRSGLQVERDGPSSSVAVRIARLEFVPFPTRRAPRVRHKTGLTSWCLGRSSRARITCCCSISGLAWRPPCRSRRAFS